jgi:hypothetical protein
VTGDDIDGGRSVGEDVEVEVEGEPKWIVVVESKRPLQTKSVHQTQTQTVASRRLSRPRLTCDRRYSGNTVNTIVHNLFNTNYQ